MQLIAKLKYPHLYRLWGALFVLTALLGLLFPEAEGAGQFFLLLIAVCFFLPPWLILTKAKADHRIRDVRIIRLLSLASLLATMILFCAGILSVRFGEGLGDVVHILMTILCAPLTCGNYYVVPMFLWATLLVGSFGKKS